MSVNKVGYPYGEVKMRISLIEKLCIKYSSETMKIDWKIKGNKQIEGKNECDLNKIGLVHYLHCFQRIFIQHKNA